MAARKKTGARRRPKLRTLGLARVQTEECSKSHTILDHAHDSAQHFLGAFHTVREARGAGAGSPLDEEQDLLRAMLVMAAAGLDSMAKQLIRDALPCLVETDDLVREGLERFGAKSIRGGTETLDSLAGSKFLARILAASDQQEQLIEEYVGELTGGSLQSPDELARTAGAFGLKPDAIGIDFPTVRTIFDLRNKIIHELDINLDAERRNRNLRRRDTLMRHANTLLEIGERLLREVDGKVAAAQLAL